MATYISFLSFTEQGVKTIKDLPARIAAGRQALEAKGGNLRTTTMRAFTEAEIPGILSKMP